MEFIDIEFATKLGLALLVGGSIGAEREYHDKAAGFRTIILICVGATLFTHFSELLGGDEDPVRIAASVVSGVGFLGAGVILRHGGQVLGLTTASTIWLTAALGMGLGGGFYIPVLIAASIILLILWVFPSLEIIIDNIRERRHYHITLPQDEQKVTQLDALIEEHHLNVISFKLAKEGTQLFCEWRVDGHHNNHDQLMARLIADPEIEKFPPGSPRESTAWHGTVAAHLLRDAVAHPPFAQLLPPVYGARGSLL